MPQSITIASFVLGAVLMLIALLGGGFKIFGTEVSSTAGTVQRIVAGGLGVPLIVVGLLGSFDFATHQPVDVKPSSSASILPERNNNAEPASTTQRPSAEVAHVPQSKGSDHADISGQWLDEIGGVYNIVQRDGDFTFQAHNPSIGARCQGSGRIVGRQVTSEFEVSTPSGIQAVGTGRATVVDENTMVGTYYDSYYGQYNHTLTRSIQTLGR